MHRAAPVILFTYNRPDHLKITLDCLHSCDLIEHTPVFVFCDGAKSDESDKKNVQAVKSLLENYTFASKSIHMTFGLVNSGLAKSIISGIDEVFLNYDRAIILEDDISVSENFLTTMNEMLTRYKDHREVCSLSGYVYPIETPDGSEDFFLLPRASSWGWATWSNRWSGVDWEIQDFGSFINDSSAKQVFNLGGEDLTPMLWKWKFGINNSWAVRWSYHHYKLKQYCVFPRRSMVYNHGNDGSGTHSPKSSKFHREVVFDQPLVVPSEVSLDSALVVQLQYFSKLSLVRKVINYFSLLYHSRIKGDL